MSREMLDMVEVLAHEKNVEKAAVFGVLEMALASAVKKSQFPGEDADVVVTVNRNTGDWSAVRRWLIVSDDQGLQQPDREEMFSDIEEDYPELNVGDYIEKPIENINTSGRRFAQDAKQVILQRLRDAEREQILNEFLAREEKVVSGQVKRVDKDGAIIEIGRLEARLPRSEMIPRENLRTSDRVRAYVLRVDESTKGKQVILSRACPEFLIKLFELEVPEIEEGVVEIKSAARDPGARAKIAVLSRDKRVEPVGTCIGIRGSRVTAVTNELAGERIDVVRWDENPVQYIVESLKPAKVSKVVADEEATSMDVTVEEDNLAIAIGRGGQNVRLATELTGWQINIMTADEANEKHEAEIGEARGEFMAELDMDQEAATALVECGIYSLEELAYVPEQEIIDLGIFDAETVVELRERARNALLARALQREENLRQADASLLALEGMDNDLASKLVSADVKTADDLGDLDVEELMEKTGLEEEAAKQLIMAARATWTE
ncbi:MAG: transcription termination/antitermination protein NusA [Duodenibacillus sp.]|nr:transcription termination/antitermination protein NusA [Duodenibacillus sp.]